MGTQERQAQNQARALIFGVIGQYDLDITFTREELSTIQITFTRYQILSNFDDSAVNDLIDTFNNIICKHIPNYKPVSKLDVHAHSRLIKPSLN
jgi:hypothetical protein